MNKPEVLEQLKQHVSRAAANPAFKHHAWFVKWHLEIVEAITKELLAIHSEADEFTALTLAWLHDYEKIINFDAQYNTELIATHEIMRQVGYDEAFIASLGADINRYNAKQELEKASIEIQIVSSADAASHMVGPFRPLYWQENPDQPFEDIMAENYRKLQIDWEQKIVLPEVKNAFAHRYNSMLELAGHLPEKYI